MRFFDTGLRLKDDSKAGFIRSELVVVKKNGVIIQSIPIITEMDREETVDAFLTRHKQSIKSFMMDGLAEVG